MINETLKENEIPIFFATDDNYIPFLDVAISSLIQNASKEYKYKIIVLNTGIRAENIAKVKLLESDYASITFTDISEHIEEIRNKLRNVYHFGLAAYYRLFIESLFPNYHRVLYLDCDIVVLGDISKLYFTDLKGNMLAGAVEQFVYHTPEFSNYTREALGVEPKDYINSGIIIMDLDKFRAEKIEDRFTDILNTFNFLSIAPDQDYLNFLCHNKILILPNEWNRTPIELEEEAKPLIAHFALYKKPWQYDDVMFQEYFWEYAKKSRFYDEILNIKNSFDDNARAKKEKANIDIKNQATQIANSPITFRKILLNK